MLRLFKILLLILVLVAVGTFLMSCGTGGNAQVRVINAIDSTTTLSLDIYVNGNKVASPVTTGEVYPAPATPAAYVSVPSGHDTVNAYDTGTSTQTNGLYGTNGDTETISGSTDYTMVLVGPNPTSPSIYLFTDSNTIPTSGTMNVRVINASSISSANGGIGYSIYTTGQTPPAATTVAFGQTATGTTDGYVPIPFESGQTYFLEVFLKGNATPQFIHSFTPGGSSTAGQVTTFVIIDSNGQLDRNPIYMVDLN